MAKEDQAQESQQASSRDYVLGQGTRVFAADIGTTRTSHGNGEPTIDQGLVEAREAQVKRENDQVKAEEDYAKRLGVKR